MGAKYYGIYRDSNGDVIASPTINVYVVGTTTHAPIFSDEPLTTPIVQPFTGGADGSVEFFAGSGQYKVQVEKSGFGTWLEDNLILIDLTETLGFRTLSVIADAGANASVSVGQPSQVWTMQGRATAGNAYVVRDITAGNNVFVIEPAAAENSVYIDNVGHIGFGTIANATWQAHFKHSAPSGVVYLVLENTASGISLFDLRTADQTWQINVNLDNSYRLFDGTNGNVVIQVESGAAQHSIFIDANGNIGHGAAPSAGGGVGLVYQADAGTVPTSNPTGGGIFYSTGGAGTWRGSGGTVTTFGPSEPHCGRCGYDFWRVVSENERWGARLLECGWCGGVHREGPESVLDLLHEGAQLVEVQ